MHDGARGDGPGGKGISAQSDGEEPQPTRALPLDSTGNHTALARPTPRHSTPSGTVSSTPSPTQYFPSLDSGADVSEIVAEAGPELLPRSKVRHYELIRELGRGGMAKVYLARDTKLGRRVAMKFILSQSEDQAKRFVAEARTTAKCSHENIVVIHEVDVHEGVPFMVLEYLDGRPLNRVIGKRRMPPARAVELMIPVVRALKCAHEQGIVHRDLKPENILLTSAGQIKVLDFGIAKVLEEGRRKRKTGGDLPGSDGVETFENLTMDGTMVGTPRYMSPEQFGADDVDHRSDLWAVGIMLYRMVSAKHPVGRSAELQELWAQTCDFETAFSSVLSVAPDIPEDLAKIIDTCLEKQKSKRWKDAGTLLRALEALLPGRYGRKLDDGESPYPGLSAFQESDADRFFGRSRDIARGIVRLRETPIVAVVGPSGVGKSSYVRAGLVPTLKGSGEVWEIVTLRPGRTPLAVLAGVLSDWGEQGSERELTQRLIDEPGLLGSRIRQRAREDRSRTLLFVDQFEELYTLCGDEQERAAFTRCLAGVADDSRSRLRVVVSMRSDLFDRVAEDPDFADQLMRGLILLGPPDEAGMREALRAPLEMVGYGFESSEIIDDMLSGLESANGALPLLQFVASKLWDERDRDKKLLTRTAYESIGGIAGALATHADEVLLGLSEAAQRFARALFQRLVTPDRTRAIVDIKELLELVSDAEEARRTINYLVTGRLLTVQTSDDGGQATVELVHESLITSWPTLKRWLDDSEEDAAFIAQLRTVSKQWHERDRPEGLLWRGSTADEAIRWNNSGTSDLTERERAYLDSVVSLATRSARRKRFFALFGVIGLATVAVAAMIAVVLVRGAEQEAKDLAVAAQREAERAKTAEVVAKQAEANAKAAQRQEAAAKQKVLDQLRIIEKAEGDRAIAVEQADQANVAVALSKEELQSANRKLRDALDRAKSESEKAKAASKAAAAAQKRAEDALAVARARVRKLEKQKGKISTTLN